MAESLREVQCHTVALCALPGAGTEHSQPGVCWQDSQTAAHRGKCPAHTPGVYPEQGCMSKNFAGGVFLHPDFVYLREAERIRGEEQRRRKKPFIKTELLGVRITSGPQ